MLNISPLQSYRDTPRSALKKKNFSIYNPNQRLDRKGNLIGIGNGYQITISDQIQYFEIPKQEKDEQSRKITAASPECGLVKSFRKIETVVKEKSGTVKICGSIEDNQFQKIQKKEIKTTKKRKVNKCCIIM